MPKYWGKQIVTHGSFPEVGQKQKTEKKKKKMIFERFYDFLWPAFGHGRLGHQQSLEYHKLLILIITVDTKQVNIENCSILSEVFFIQNIVRCFQQGWKLKMYCQHEDELAQYLCNGQVLWWSSIFVVIYFGCLPFWLSSILVVFYWKAWPWHKPQAQVQRQSLGPKHFTKFGLHSTTTTTPTQTFRTLLRHLGC